MLLRPSVEGTMLRHDARIAKFALAFFAWFVGGGLERSEAGAAAPPPRSFHRAEFQNQGGRAFAFCGISLLDAAGAAMPDPEKVAMWPIVSDGAVGYGRRVESRWGRGVGYENGTTFLPNDSCDHHRTFLPESRFSKEVSGVYGVVYSLWVLGETWTASLCATSQGIMPYDAGEMEMPKGARQVAGSLVIYEGIVCCCGRAKHSYLVRTYFYSGFSGGQELVERRLQVAAQEGAALGRASVARTPAVSPVVAGGGADDGPAPPKNFEDFELRNRGNKQIRSAKVKAYVGGQVIFQEVYLAEPDAALGNQRACLGAASADPKGHVTGPSYNYQNDSPCRRRRERPDAVSLYQDVSRVVYSFTIQGADNADDTFDLCVTSGVPEAACNNQLPCDTPDTCVVGRALKYVRVDYLGLNGRQHQFEVRRVAYDDAGVAQSEETVCCSR